VNGAHERPAIAHSGIDVDILPSDNVVLVEHAGAYVRNSWVEDYIAATEERVMRIWRNGHREEPTSSAGNTLLAIIYAPEGGGSRAVLRVSKFRCRPHLPLQVVVDEI